MCCNTIDPILLKPFLAYRLIALNKNPGVRPIGISDTARRMITKAVLKLIITNIQDVTGYTQLCGGQLAGVEAAVHCLCDSFVKSDCGAALFVDRSEERR